MSSNKFLNESTNEETTQCDVIKTFRNSDGSVSSYFDKRKIRIAPRSTLQFKIGPGFESIAPNFSVIDELTGRSQELKLLPRIDRGFDFIDDEWIGYKRNYFTVVTAFDTPGINHVEFLAKNFKLSDGTEIEYFATKLAAKCLEDNKPINLVQHTAKRDKGPQYAPPIHGLVPSQLPKHQIIRDASNVRNEVKMKRFDNYFYLTKSEVVDQCGTSSTLSKYPMERIKKVARYERIQFASSIALKKTTQQNRRFALFVVLGCFVKGRHSGALTGSPYCELEHYDVDSDMTFLPIIMEKTPPLIIRGRSPSNYCQNIKVMHTKKIDYEVPDSKERELIPQNFEKKKRGRKAKTMRKNDSFMEDGQLRFQDLFPSTLPVALEQSPGCTTLKQKSLSIQSPSTEASFPRGSQSESLSVAYLSNTATPIQESIFKKRKLNISKPVLLESSLEDPLDDVSDNLFNTTSYEEKSPIKDNKECISSTSIFLLRHVTYEVAESPAVAIPRTMLPNKMEISYCLNDYSSGFIDYRPPTTSTKRLLTSRRLLTASGNPSDLLNPGDWSEGPSIFHH